MDIGRGIAHADELARLMGVRQVDHGDRNFADYLIVIYPRIEYRIQQWHDQTEKQHALVVKHLLHLKTPHVGGILQPVVYLMEYRHR